jgi:hypothetical protein
VPFAVPPAITTRKPLFTPGMQVNWEHPLNRGLVGWWLCNEGAGNSLNAVHGPRLSGLVNHTWNVSLLGQSVSSPDDNLLYSASAFTYGLDDIVGPGTVVAIVSPYATDGLYGIFQSTDGIQVDYKGFSFSIDKGGRTYTNSLEFRIDANSWVAPGNDFLGASSDQRWHIVGISWDGVTAIMMANGNIYSVAYAYLPSASTWRRVRIGSGTGGQGWGIKTAGIGMWKRALSMQELVYVSQYPYGTPDNPRLI